MTDTDTTQPQDDGPSAGRIIGHLSKKLLAERAAHEEHRQQLADALGEAPRRDWEYLIRSAGASRAEAVQRGMARDRAEAALTRVRDAVAAAVECRDGNPHACPVEHDLLGTHLDAIRAALGDDQPAEAECDGCVGCGGPDCIQRPEPAVVREQPAGPDPDDGELTAEEARAEVDRLATELYQAQDALAFVAEMCDIADRSDTPVTTARVREWLKGAQCARQAGLVFTHGPIVDAVRRALGEQQ